MKRVVRRSVFGSLPFDAEVRIRAVKLFADGSKCTSQALLVNVLSKNDNDDEQDEDGFHFVFF